MSFIIYLYYILLPTNYALHCIFYSLIRLRQNLPNKILPFPSLSTWLSVPQWTMGGRRPKSEVMKKLLSPHIMKLE